MMRRQSCLCALTTIILATLSLTAHSSQVQYNPPLSNTHSEWSVHSATPVGRVRVIITKNKPKLHLPKSYKPVTLLKLDDDDNDYYDDLLEFQVGYRRPELVNQTAKVNDDISDEIKLRLVLARKRALERHKEVWG